MSKYSDADVVGKTCPGCNGTGKSVRRSTLGQPCEPCKGSGMRYPRRRDVMAQRFARGEMPDQGAPPSAQWCAACRPGGVFRLSPAGRPIYDSCTTCGGTTIIRGGARNE